MPVFGAGKFERFVPQDPPHSMRLQENMHAFRAMNEEIALAPILEQPAGYPPLTRPLAVETEQRRPMVVGGHGLAVACTSVTIDARPVNRNRRPGARRPRRRPTA
jgi:hypothetical protein